MMITLTGPHVRCCDRVSRRSFLQIGGLSLGGFSALSLPQLLAAESQTGTRHKAVISILLAGGMSHHDTFDMKPEAPEEVRGQFKPIATNLPGVRICELLPKTAQMMDKLVLIRSLTGMADEHSSFQNCTGFRMNDTNREGHPHFGSIVSRVQGPTDPVVPSFVDLYPEMKFKPYNSPGPGRLGRAHAGMKVDGEDLANMKLQFVDRQRFNARRQLLGKLKRLEQRVEDTPGLEPIYEQAFQVLTESRVVEAVDLEREDPALRDRYGRGSSEVPAGGGPMWNDQFLMARRLIEAGVRCVSIAYGGWDTHKHNFPQLKKNLPLFDTGVSALVEDLHNRGLADDVTVVIWGEFGRTPKINKDGGRDHWAPVNFCLLAGDVNRGQVIGSTDNLGAAVNQRPIHFHDVFATVYHNLGIDPHSMVLDPSGRPSPVMPGNVRPIPEVLRSG